MMTMHYLLVKPVPEHDHPFNIYANVRASASPRSVFLHPQTNPLLAATKLMTGKSEMRACAAWLRERLECNEYRVTRSYPKAVMSHVFTTSRHPLPKARLADVRIVCDIISRIFGLRVLLAWNTSELQYIGDVSETVFAYCVRNDKSVMARLSQECDVAAELLKLAARCA